MVYISYYVRLGVYCWLQLSPTVRYTLLLSLQPPLSQEREEDLQNV
jgi:hypothetical protein